MFRQGKTNVQKSMFDQERAFPDYILKMLRKSWADDFFRLVFRNIDEERFSVLYSDKASRPNKAVNVLVGLLILKQQNAISDEELIGSLYFDYRFQYALGLESDVNMERLCINTLSNFRCRLVEHELQTGESLLQQEMESLSEKMSEFLSLNKAMARMDSMMIESSCKKMTRIELVYTVVRNMIRELNKVENLELPESLAAFLEKDHQNKTIYRTTSNEERSKLEKLLDIAHDCYQWVQKMSVCTDTTAFQHLNWLLQEQCVETDEGVVVPVEGKNISPKSLQNPSDPDATFRHKSGEDHIGSSLNLVEVHDPDQDVGLIMHADMKENTHSDADFGEDFVKHHALSDEIKSLAVDGAYYRHETVKEADDKDLEINFSHMTGRSVSDEQVGTHRFEIDPETYKITKCPQGQVPFYSEYDPKAERYTAKFEKWQCDACPLRDFCQVKEQKKAYHIAFSEKKRRTDETRAKMGTERHKQLANYRAGVEGVPSVLKRVHNVDNIPIRGQVRSKIWIFASIIAQNFKRCTKHLRNGVPATT